MAKNYSIVTLAGQAAYAESSATGTPIEFTHMAIGTGTAAPSETQTALQNEVYRAELNELAVSSQSPNWFLASLYLPPEVGGWSVAEAGLYDKRGRLIALLRMEPTPKPTTQNGDYGDMLITMTFAVTNGAQVILQVDPAKVMATKDYVDRTLNDVVMRQDYKASALATTTGSVTLSGLALQPGGDWLTALTAGARILVKNQTNAAENGIYVANAGAWARAADADSNLEVTPGLIIAVETGVKHAGSLWQLVTVAPINLGTTVLTFEMAAGRTGVTAGTYRVVTVDDRGRVLAGANPTTLAGYGISNAIGYYEQLPAAKAEPVIYVPPYGFMAWIASINMYRSVGCGSIIMHPSATPHTGTIKANGPVLSKTTYAGLWSHAQEAGLVVTSAEWQAGTTMYADLGGDSFRAPDLRAEFPRFWDDARGIDPGRAAGSWQKGTLSVIDTGTAGIWSVGTSLSGPAADVLAAGGLDPYSTSDYPTGRVIGANSVITTALPGTLNDASYSGIARPRNVALTACIKF